MVSTSSQGRASFGDQAVKKMKGRPGTKVKLTIISDDGETKTLTLKRAIIKVESVKSSEKMLAGADSEDD